jgi:type VI secretion system secreted protein VgrG
MVNPSNPFAARSILVDGLTGLKDPKVARFSGREAISRPFEYELIVQAESSRGTDGKVDATKLLGHPVTVTIAVEPAGAQRHFNGVVTEFAHVDFNEHYHEYRAVLRPAFWLLSRRADCRVFQKKSTPDIVGDICQQCSVAHRLNLSATYQPWEYRVQYRESDFDFLSRLLEHEGIYYYFEHAKGQHTLVLADDVGKLKEMKGYDKVPYKPPGTSSTQQARDCLNSWAVYESFQPAASATTDYNFEQPSDKLNVATPVAKRSDSGRYEIFEYPAAANPMNRTAVQHLTKVRAEQYQSAQAVARSGGDAAGLAPGHIFALTDHPRTDFNKRWLVVSTTLEASSNTGKTAAGGKGDAYVTVRAESVDAALPFRPERGTPKPLIQGSQTARIVGPSGKEIWTDKYGRVKVQFHWDRAGKADDASSCWVRVASGWAGKNWGLYQIPRVGQEVVVSFLEGDPDRPLVIGSVFNAEHMPPYELPTNMTRSGAKSRTSAEGTADHFNELRFEDKKGAEEIYLHAEKDLQVVVENNQTISVGATKKDKGDRAATIQNDDKLDVGNDLTVSIKGKETRTVEKDRSTTAKANDKLDVKKEYTLSAGDSLTLKCGSGKIVMKSDGSIEISGSEVKVKGTSSATVDAAQTTIKGTTLDVKGSKTAVDGSGTLDLSSSGVASLKGSLTKIG